MTHFHPGRFFSSCILKLVYFSSKLSWCAARSKIIIINILRADSKVFIKILNLDGFLIFNVCLCANVERLGALVSAASTAEN